MEAGSIVAIIVACITSVVGPAIMLWIKADLEKRAKKREEDARKREEKAEAARIQAEEEAKKREEERKEDIRRREQERRDNFKAIAEEVVAPLKKELADVKAVVELDKEATVVSIRSTLKARRDAYMSQGYADIGDKATWNELYEKYGNLGGNHFHEYVDLWKEDVNNLPESKKSKK